MEDLKIEQQMALEEDMRGLGIARYIKNMTASEEAELPPGALLLRQSVLPLSQAIQTWIDDLRAGNPRRMASILNAIEEVGAAECAYLTMRRMINAVSGRMKTTAFAVELGGDLEEELEYRDFKKTHPKLFKAVAEQVKTSSSDHYRSTVLHLARRRSGVADKGWDKETKLKIGVKLMEMAIESTGLVEINTVQEGPNHTVHYLMGTPKTLEWLEKQHGHCQVLSPLYLPMVCKPNPWVAPKVGGYMTVKLDMVKTPNKNYLEELAHVDMPIVYGALNSLQNTGWRINKRIMEVMQQLWERGGDRAGLPPKEGRPIPPKPHDIDTNEESLKAWKKKAKPVYNWNHRNMSKVIGMAQKLWVAEKFAPFEEFFYVWTLDWRGRAYPVGTFVHPQSDDTGKSLLEFSQGKPLGETGAAWLAVQLANTWGNDKVSFDDRIQWTQDNTSMILGCAFDPLVNREWMDADSPFGFLAACFEWAGYKMMGTAYVSHLPIQVDGSCNGLQNFSAMLLDEIGGRATNLIPSEKPQDIYGLVAAEANKIIDEDWHVRNTTEAEVFLGRITRKLTKRNTMTMPYSVTQFGMKDQLLEEFRKLADDGKPLDYLGCDEFACAGYLAGVNYKAIGKVVVAARNAMDWLKEVAKIAASDALPVVWTNPAGMPIQQNYQATTGKRIELTVGGKVTKFTIQVDGKKLDGRKQAAGIAPNFVHSCDSGHMMRTLVKALDAGITSFSFIHDSYGTHACDMTDLAAILREAFVEQYSEGILERFREEIIEQLALSGSNELIAKIPAIPPKGTLDLEAVKDSQYFFA